MTNWRGMVKAGNTSKGEVMEIKYHMVVQNELVMEEPYFEDVCCESMRKALLKQETPLGKEGIEEIWLYCPFCKTEIVY